MGVIMSPQACTGLPIRLKGLPRANPVTWCAFGFGGSPQAHSGLLLFAVFSCLVNNNWELTPSFHFDASLFVFMSFKAA